MEESEQSDKQTEKGKMNALLPIGAIVVVALFAGVFLLTNKNNTQNQQAADSAPQQTNNTVNTTDNKGVQGASDQADSSVKTVSVDAGSFYYKPNTITVKKGQKVKIVMTSKDMMHDFNIDDLNVHMPVTQSGETGTVEFTADKVGTFEYYCSVGNHRQRGQVGTLTVE